jgi:hypothetical protein
MDKQRSEDTLIVYGYNPKSTDTTLVLKEFAKFFARKQEIDSTDRFNFIAFNNMKPVYFENFLYDWESIINYIQTNHNTFVIPNISGALYLACTFMIDVFKIVGGKVFRVVILTDKDTPEFNNVEVVEQLMDNIRDFPVFIDFICLNRKNPTEEQKYVNFAKKYGGIVLNVKNEKELGNAFEKLAQKKRSPSFPKGVDQLHLESENEPFFFNLAQEPIEIEEDSAQNKNLKCLICRKKGDNLIKCPKCGTPTHPPCLAQWAKISQIGIPHVFRCVQCFNLLRLPKPFVMDVQSGAYFERINKIQMQVNMQTQANLDMQMAIHYEELRVKEQETKPQIVEADDPFALFDDFYAENK